MSECRVCGVEHSPDVHQAVLNIRAYVRSRVCRDYEVAPGEKSDKPAWGVQARAIWKKKPVVVPAGEKA